MQIQPLNQALAMPQKVGSLKPMQATDSQSIAQLKQAAQGFESLFLEKMLETMQAANKSFAADDGENANQNQTLLSIANTAVAKQLASQGSLGIANMLMNTLGPKPHPSFTLPVHKE